MEEARERERALEREREYIRRDSYISSSYTRQEEPLSSVGATWRPSMSGYSYHNEDRLGQYSQYYPHTSSSVYTSSYAGLRDPIPYIGGGASFTSYVASAHHYINPPSYQPSISNVGNTSSRLHPHIY